MSTSKTILITGASTGFGRDTAETVPRARHTVFASIRIVSETPIRTSTFL
jgi:NAD(P)-dependent dehydrogenase (short-subunit alcohol dehydrogenase family)